MLHVVSLQNDVLNSQRMSMGTENSRGEYQRMRAPDNEGEVLLVHVAASAHGDKRVRVAAHELAASVGRSRRRREHGHLTLAEVQHHVLIASQISRSRCKMHNYSYSTLTNNTVQ